MRHLLQNNGLRPKNWDTTEGNDSAALLNQGMQPGYLEKASEIRADVCSRTRACHSRIGT